MTQGGGGGFCFEAEIRDCGTYTHLCLKLGGACILSLDKAINLFSFGRGACEHFEAIGDGSCNVLSSAPFPAHKISVGVRTKSK